MKNVKITNWKGNTYEGYWNEKFYSSKINGHSELFRIYLDGNSFHITEDEKNKILGNEISPDVTNELSKILEEYKKNEKLTNWGIIDYKEYKNIYYVKIKNQKIVLLNRKNKSIETYDAIDIRSVLDLLYNFRHILDFTECETFKAFQEITFKIRDTKDYKIQETSWAIENFFKEIV